MPAIMDAHMKADTQEEARGGPARHGSCHYVTGHARLYCSHC